MVTFVKLQNTRSMLPIGAVTHQGHMFTKNQAGLTKHDDNTLAFLYTSSTLGSPQGSERPASGWGTEAARGSFSVLFPRVVNTDHLEKVGCICSVT